MYIYIYSFTFYLSTTILLQHTYVGRFLGTVIETELERDRSIVAYRGTERKRRLVKDGTWKRRGLDQGGDKDRGGSATRKNRGRGGGGGGGGGRKKVRIVGR